MHYSVGAYAAHNQTATARGGERTPDAAQERDFGNDHEDRRSQNQCPSDKLVDAVCYTGSKEPMATFYAEQSFDYTNLNLNRLVANQTDFDFQDNVGITFNGRVYQDLVTFEHYSGGYVATAFAGSGFTFSANYAAVTGGTVTGVIEQYWTGSSWLTGWWLEGFSFSGVALANAANTSGTADDYAAIQSILSGNDRINLSDYSDKMTGYGGNDSIFGFGGNDTLLGEGGNDSIDGGTGSDQLFGGAGNDIYRVDSSSDRVYETATTTSSVDLGGYDTVQSSVSITLPAFVEGLLLGGTSALNGTGNTVANMITGNTKNNTLSGGGGNDTLTGGEGNDRLDGGSGNDKLDGSSGADSMSGGSGNDSYKIQNSGDMVAELADGGTDSVSSTISYTLSAEVEKLTLTGTSNLSGTGNGLHNTLVGNASNNILRGSTGNDTVTGGAGLDVFRFSSALNASTNVDSLLDLNVADDRLELENSVFTKLTVPGVLSSSNFRANTSGTASDSNDYVLYETDTGKLFYDADGSGAGSKVWVATLSNLAVLTHADIFVT
jgi:Ca2+-binding RTX toxin-like protein